MKKSMDILGMNIDISNEKKQDYLPIIYTNLYSAQSGGLEVGLWWELQLYMKYALNI